LTKFKFESGTVSFVLPLSLYCSENCVCLSRGMQVVGAGMTCSDENHARSRRPDAEDRGWSHMSGTWWPDDRQVG
jgi:hypothetical protein